MKIAIICDVLGKENNGTTIAGMNLIRSLAQKGHEVTVVAPDEVCIEGVKYYPVKKRSFGILNGYVERNGVCLAVPDREVLTKAIEGADVVHCLLPFSVGCVAVDVAKELGIPVTASFHFQAENLTAHLKMQKWDFINTAIYKNRYKKFFSKVDYIHYPTQFIRGVFERAIKGKTPARVISNGVSDAFENNYSSHVWDGNGKFTIICTGRYSREKNQQVLIRAVARSKYKDKLRIIFAGDGPRKDKLVSLAKKLGVDAEFKFFDREGLLSALRQAHLYVHTAEVEIEAIACLEAIASGLTPVIANSHRSATKDYALSDKNLFEHNDASDLKDMIEMWYKNPSLMRDNGDLYAEFTKGIGYQACMEQMEKMLIDASQKRVKDNA